MYSTLSKLSLLSRFVTEANLHSRASYLKLQSSRNIVETVENLIVQTLGSIVPSMLL